MRHINRTDKNNSPVRFRPRYVDTNGEFQVEIKLSNVETYFEKDLFFTKNIMATLKGQDPDAIKSHIQVRIRSKRFHFPTAILVRRRFCELPRCGNR